MVAMSLAAKSMGFANEEMSQFIKLVSEGKVSSKEFISAYSNELRNYVRDTKSLEAALDSMHTMRQRFITTFQLGIDKGFTEATPGLKDFFTALSRLTIENMAAFSVIGEGIGFMFKALAFSMDLMAPALNLFTSILERIRVVFNDAFDPAKTASDLGFFSSMVRKLGGLFKIVLGTVQLLIAYMLELFQLIGAEDSLDELVNALSLLIGAGMLIGLGKVLGKLLGINSALRLMRSLMVAVGLLSGVKPVIGAGKSIFKKGGRKSKGKVTGTPEASPGGKFGNLGKAGGVLGALLVASEVMSSRSESMGAPEGSNLFGGGLPSFINKLATAKSTPQSSGIKVGDIYVYNTAENKEGMEQAVIDSLEKYLGAEQ